VVLYSAQEKLERYNMPDSLKAQHTAHYTRGHVLMSDMGRALASITADTPGLARSARPAAGRRRMTEKYGEHGYQAGAQRHVPLRPHGLLDRDRQIRPVKRDLVAPVNLFSKVSVDERRPLPLPARALQGRRLRRPAPGHGRACSPSPPRRIRSTPAGLRAEEGRHQPLWRSGPAAPTITAAPSAPNARAPCTTAT
jgi:hypothetical protein